MLLTQLDHRFGTPPDDIVARVKTANDSQLDAWARAIFDALTLEELFDPQPAVVARL